MDERQFEADLERQFNQAPAFDDNEAFARRVSNRLEKGWRLRAVGIASAGAIGGLIALSQTIRAGLNLGVAHASAGKIDAVYSRATTDVVSFAGVDLSSLDLSALGLNANLFGMVAVALLLAGAAAGVRLINET